MKKILLLLFGTTSILLVFFSINSSYQLNSDKDHKNNIITVAPAEINKKDSLGASDSSEIIHYELDTTSIPDEKETIKEGKENFFLVKSDYKNKPIIEKIEPFELISTTDIYHGIEGEPIIEYINFNYNKIFSLDVGDILELPVIKGSQYNMHFVGKISENTEEDIFTTFYGDIYYHDEPYTVFFTYYPKENVMTGEIQTPDDDYKIAIDESGNGIIQSWNDIEKYKAENSGFSQVEHEHQPH